MNRRRLTGHRLSVPASPAADPLADVAAYWRFEGVTGVSPILLDDAIGSLDLTLNSSTGVTWPAGKNNNAFSHTTSSNTRFFAQSSSQNSLLDPSTTSGAFTFSVWQKLAVASFAAPTSPMSPMLAFLDSGSNWAWMLWREYHAGNYATVRFATRDAGSTIDVIEGTGLSFGDSDWHHYCVTIAAGTAKLYFDGQLIASGASSGMDSTNSTRFGIGSLAGYSQLLSGIFRNLGQTDEAGYWTRELTAAEVTALYNGGTGTFLP